MKNHPKLLGIWFFKDFQGAEFLGPNHFQEGVLSKQWHFFFQNFHLGRKLFPSLTKSKVMQFCTYKLMMTKCTGKGEMNLWGIR